MADGSGISLECPVCHGGEAAVVLRSRNGYPIVRCGRCGLAFTDMRTAPPPSALYPEFEQSEGAVHRSVRRWLGVFARQREAIVRRVKPSGRLLDFGCGSGAFARWMAAAGYEVVGLEPFSLGKAVESERLLLVREPLESAAPKLRTFDVITLWHVLEHLSAPVEVLQRLSGLLAPGGALVVSVPNFRSWQSRVFRGGWFHLDPPRHMLHFEPESLGETLRRAGLVAFRSWDFLPEYGSSGWVQSTLNSLLPHTNYLYELVKDRGALKGLGVASHVFHMGVSAVASPPAFILSAPVEALASARQRGAALTVAARRAAE